MPLPLVDTLTSDHRLDFSKIEATFNGIIFSGITELSYRHGLEPGELRGASAKVLGFTRGEYSCDGSFSMYKADYQRLISALGAAGTALNKGYMEMPFVLTSVYEESLTSVLTDKLVGVRITNDEDSHSTGGDALVVSVDFVAMELTRSGAAAVGAGSVIGQIAGAVAGLLP